MEQIIDLDWRRELGDCFYLEIPLDRSLDEIRATISYSTSVEYAVKRMLDGEMSLNDLAEELEPVILDLDLNFDGYLEVVEENMNYTLLSLNSGF